MERHPDPSAADPADPAGPAGVSVHRRGDHQEVPWRNGRGTTWEVVATAPPVTAGDAAFGWRLSFAEVVGRVPFSEFPGVDRTITLVDGGPLRLTVEGRSRVLERHAPFAFVGEAQVESVAEAPSVDLNVMVLRGHVAAAVAVHALRAAGGPLAVEPADEALVVVLDGAVTVSSGHWSTTAGARDVVRAAGAPLEVAGTGVVQLVRLSAAVDRPGGPSRA